MTNTEYRSELASILGDIFIIEYATWEIKDELSMVARGFAASECEDGEFASAVLKSRFVTGRLDRLRDLEKGLSEYRSYRARLSRWFHGSRIGAPPLFAKAK